MAKDTIKVNMNVYDIPILVEQLKILETENKQLKERIDKAIEYMQDYCELVVPEANIKSLILKEEYKKIIEILGDKEDNTITLNTKDMNITGGKYER